jgi:hypothetical protein
MVFFHLLQCNALRRSKSSSDGRFVPDRCAPSEQLQLVVSLETGAPERLRSEYNIDFPSVLPGAWRGLPARYRWRHAGPDRGAQKCRNPPSQEMRRFGCSSSDSTWKRSAAKLMKSLSQSLNKSLILRLLFHFHQAQWYSDGQVATSVRQIPDLKVSAL